MMSRGSLVQVLAVVVAFALALALAFALITAIAVFVQGPRQDDAPLFGIAAMSQRVGQYHFGYKDQQQDRRANDKNGKTQDQIIRLR